MVSVRKRTAPVSYTEPKATEGLEEGSDEEGEQVEEPPPAQARKTPPRPRARKRAAPEQPADADADASLLGVVKKHGASIAVAAKDWVDRYRASRGAATAELLTFLLQACGVDHVLSEEEVEEGEVDAQKQELDRQAQEEGLDDHWRGPKAAAKALRANYLEMWDKIVREAAAADVALWDGHLLDKLSSLLIALNTSVVREFRFVATLTAAQLVTSWVHVGLTLGEARDTAERQLAAEEKKKGGGGKAAADRVAAFRRTVERCHARVQELRAYSDSLFQGVFAHRFRDCSEEIRATVIEGVGGWARLHPAAYLTDQYLKYIAWALSDKDARVRLASVSALLALYGNPDNRGALADFTARFQQRFGELFYDVDEAVAVKGVQLNTLLVRLREAAPGQYTRVYELLADDSAALRHAVAELVASALQEQGQQVLQAAAAGRSGGKRGRRLSAEAGGHSTAELQLAGLLQVLHLLANPPRDDGGAQEEGEEAAPLEREVVAQVVDALFDRVPMLSDWPLLLGWAQQGTAEQHFGEAGLTDLLHVLRDALRRATGGGGAKPGSRERQQAQAAARQDATLALMKELPALLRKVQAHPAQAAALVGAIPDMKLEVYALKRQERAFGQLAAAVKGVFLKHADAEVARECVAALAACAASGPDAIRDAAALALTECGADAAAGLAAGVGALERAGEARLRAAADALAAGGGDEEGEEGLLFGVRAPLVRLQALLTLGGGALAEEEEVHDSLAALLESAAGGSPLPDSIVGTAARCQLLLLMWRLRALDAELPDGAALRSLAAARAEYAGRLQSLAAAPGSDALGDEVAAATADLWLVFSAARAAGTPLAPACFSPSDSAVEAFWALCEGAIRRDAGVEEGDGAAEVAAKMAPARAAAARAASLAAFAAVPQHGWLAGQLLSQWVGPEAAGSAGAVRRWAPVADVVKETARALKRRDPAALPGTYLGAMRAAYDRIPAPPPDAPLGGEDEGPPPAEQEFLALCDRVAKTYAGFNSSASALEHIVVEGARHALSEGPALLGFLEGVAFFVRSLPPARAEVAAAAVRAAAAPHRPRDGDPDWDVLYAFLELLGRRAAKGRAKSALKRGGGGAAAPGEVAAPLAAAAAGGSGRKAPRKISFAPRDAIEEGSEEEEEQREAIEEPDEDEEQPGGWRRVLHTSSQRSGGSGGLRRQSRPSVGRRVLVHVEEAEDEGEQAAYAVEEAEEVVEEEEVEEPLPTEEQMAIPPSARPSAGRRQRQLRSLFAGEEPEQEVAAAEEEEEQDDDADLLSPYGRRPPVVDPQPEAAGGKEEEEEEERPARRRRRRYSGGGR